jgi:hypothetical protein
MENNLNLKIERPVLNYVKFREKYKFVEPKKKKFLERAKASVIDKWTPSKKCLLEGLIAKLPIIDLFRTYKLRYILKDSMSGLTVGIIQIAPSIYN